MKDPESNPALDIVDWLGDSVPFNLQSFLADDPYSSEEINSYPWWDHNQDFMTSTASYFHGNNGTNYSKSNTPDATTTTTTSSLITSEPTNHDYSQSQQQPSDLPKKRKLSEEQAQRTSNNQQQIRKINQNRESNEPDDDDVDDKAAVAAAEAASTTRKCKKNTNRSGGSNGNNKDGRWAEQLLNPCASALIAGNMTRVHHLLCVLHELASFTGDANHRLAAHGSRALPHRFSSSSVSAAPITFSATEPKFFQRSLLKFYEVSPWFAFPNNVANSSILQILAQGSEQSSMNQNLHIVDIGVSHGVQWPTLLEALTRRSGGPPPLVRITVIAPTEAIDRTVEPPFSIGPPGDNFYSKLPGFAKTLNINLHIQRLDNHRLQNLDPQIINSSPEETLIICAQFRLHHLSHSSPDERGEFLRSLRRLGPKGVILSENNMDCSCSNCGDFALGFSRRVEYLWRFLDSTSSAFKGRESEERRMMEGEAAKALTNPGEMNETKEKWCERMKEAGFSGESFGEDAVDGARALLRKYDSNWEMRTDEREGGCIGLWWKGQSVSFCSLWKLDSS